MARRRTLAIAALLVGGGAVVTAALVRAPTVDDAGAEDADDAHAVAPADAPDDADDAHAGALPSVSPLQALLGEVTDEAGAPLAASVRVELVDGSVETLATDAEGAFALERVRAEVKRVTFSAPRHTSVTVDGARLPRVPEAFWSQKLAKAAQVAGEVEGLVVDERGRPVTTFKLTIATRRRPLTEDVESSDGTFTRALDPGTSLTVTARGYRPSTQVVEGASVRFVLEKSNALRGRVTDARTGKPIAGAMVALDGVRAIEPAVTDDEGMYAIDTLPSEKASVRVRADGYVELTLGGVEGGRSRDERLDAALTPAGEGVRTEVVGIGITVGRHPEGVRVQDVFAGGPAAGHLEKNDVIIEVDGESLGGRPLRDGMSAIRGEAGTTVRLVVKKASGTVPVVLERARVAVPEG